MGAAIRFASLSIILSLLAACGGGGGGGGSVIRPEAPTPAEVAFTSFSAIAPNQPVVMSGVAQTGSGTDTAFNLDDPVSTSNTARLTFGADGKLSDMIITTPQSSVSFRAGEINCSGSGCGAANATSISALVDPFALGWNYQSFGVWMKDINPTSFQAGAISAGAVTPGSAVPTISSATFSGHAGGFYFDGAGGRFATDAQMSAVTDFSNRNIQFSTTGTVLSPIGGGATSTLDPSTLNLSGNLTYAPGTSQFSGGVNTADGTLTGSATGRFYGPSAQEIGGVYGLGSQTSSAKMVGGFGGKRP